MFSEVQTRSAEELNNPIPENPVQNVKAKRIALDAAKAQVEKLQTRIRDLQGTFHNAQARAEQHRTAVARALADGKPPPIDTERGQLDPRDAVKILEIELLQARQVLDVATGDHRAAVAGYLKQQRDGALVAVAEAVETYRAALTTAAALDRIIVGGRMQSAIAPTVHSTVIYALRERDIKQASGPGQALNGRQTMASKDVIEASVRLRTRACAELGETELPF